MKKNVITKKIRITWHACMTLFMRYEHLTKWNTVWKCHDFSVIKILREINLAESRNVRGSKF